MTLRLPTFAANPTIESVGISLVTGDTELPLESVDVLGRVDGVGVVWVVTQTFFNTVEEAIEAVYTFPLPNGGAVTDMRIKMGDRIIVADIKELEQARVEYEEALAKGQTAALMVQNRGEIFEISVGNIHPGESITVEVTVHDTVDRDGNEATVRIPTYVKERYVPAGTPDAAAVTPPRHDGGVHVASGIRVEFAQPVREAVCDTVEGAVVTDDSVVITDFALDRDVVVRWQVPAESMDAKWTPDADDPAVGTLEVVIRTNDVPRKGMHRRRALSILLDRSGSMGGWSMGTARRIVEDAIGSLSDDDLVHVLTFDSVIEALGPTEHGFERATPRLKTALKRALKSVDARGGTDLDGGITAAGAALGTIQDRDDTDEYERVVLLITDGAYGDEATAARQRDIELGGARVIVVGIGQDMNGYLETLAANGMFAYVPADHRIGDVSRTVCGRISQPAHRNARLVAPGLTDQAPHLAPDIYPESTVTLWGRMPRPADGSTVTVVTDSGNLADIPVRTCGDGSATSRWAKEHINSVDYDVMTGRTDETAGRERIVQVSIRHRVLSKYTAWLAVDTSRTTDTVIPKRIVQPTYAMDMMDDMLASPMLLSVNWHSTMDRVSPSVVHDMSIFFPGDAPQGHLGILVDLIDELVELLDWSDDMIDVDAVLDCVLRIAIALDRRGLHGLDRGTRDKIKRRAAKVTGRQRPADAVIISIAREIVDLHTDGQGRSRSTQP